MSVEAELGTALGELPLSEVMAPRHRQSWAMLQLGARMRSWDVLEELCLSATGGESDWDTLSSALAALERGDNLPAAWRMTGVVAASLLACVLEPDIEHLELGRRALWLGVSRVDFRAPDAQQALMLAVQITALSGDDALLEAISFEIDDGANADTLWAAQTDLKVRTNPLGGKDGRPVDPERLTEWWDSVNLPITRDGYESFELEYEAGTDVQNIFAAVHAPVVERCRVAEPQQPLVSVIMAVYNPDETFLNAVESLTRQSWQNLEVLLIDDCSSSGSELIESAAASDTRIRLIRQAENGGAYRAFNAGLAAANGEYVTFQGADDISHSRRIELQMMPLLENEGLVATLSRSQRMRTDGLQTYFGFQTHRRNVSSLLFEKEPVLAALGQFDDVRKGADSEFRERMLRVFGDDRVRDMHEVLSFVQLGVGSLSRADFHFGWVANSRLQYMTQYRGLHRRQQAGPVDRWRYDVDRPRSGWVPPALINAAPPARLRVVVAADWSAAIEDARGAVALIAELAASSESPIGLLHLDWLRGSQSEQPDFSDRLWPLLDSGVATWVNWVDGTEIDTLLVLDPECLAGSPSGVPTNLAIDSVLLAVDTTVRWQPSLEGSARIVPVHWAIDRVRALFGVEPEWVTASARIASCVRANGGHTSEGTTAHRWTGAADAVTARSGSGTDAENRELVVGLIAPARDERRFWDEQRLCGAFAGLGEARVAVLDLHHHYTGDRPTPDTWRLVKGGNDGAIENFLAEVDVLVVDPLAVGELGAVHWARRAVNAGAIVLAPQDYVADFTALVSGFSDLSDCAAQVQALSADPEQMRAKRMQAARAAAALQVHPRL